MRKWLQHLLLTLLLCSMVHIAAADSAFIVKQIKIEGLQRITYNTALNYLPIKAGQRFDSSDSDKVIESLYKTGFFSDVQLARRGNALIITVQERPTIGLIQIDGNKAISTDKLKPVLHSLGIVVGDVYDSSKLNQIVQGLQQQYSIMGYHAASITPEAKPGPQNTVSLYIHVDEGSIAKIHEIHIVGNHAFSQRTIVRQMKLTTRGLFTWISHSDRYSEIKLEEDLGHITDFYMNHGYIRFRVVSHQVKLTPDHKGVVITITVSEGEQYHISGYTITGNTMGQLDKMYPLVKFKAGDMFSRKAVIDSNRAISNFLADEGYAFAHVNALPQIDDLKHLVYLTFHITKGQRIYVRQINFLGNDHTSEQVLRREMRQMEGSAYSLENINESKRRIANLPYLKDIKVTTQRVSNDPDEVDLDYHVKEVAAGKASVQGGYSDAYGFLYGASVSEPNFMGSGKSVSLGFQNSEVQDYYNFQYTNPYYTADGISRSFNLYYTHMDPNTDYNYASYTLNGIGIDVDYGIPVTENSSISLGFGYEHAAIENINASTAAPSVLDFLGCSSPYSTCSLSTKDYDIFKLKSGWSYSTLDRYIFPTRGGSQGLGLEVGVPVLDSSPSYYKATYRAKWYHPVAYGFLVNFHTLVGYGDGYGDTDRLPFFENYYAGGLGTLPAYAPNSLGPKNTYDDNGALGGNLETFVGMDLILPDFISDKLRTAIALDAGNVFQDPRFSADTTPQIVQNDSFSIKNFRTSLGLLVTWYSPLGPIDLGLAFPLSEKDQDDLEAFQFSFGTSI